MTLPTNESIRAHFAAFGGLWLVIPKRTSAGQPRPLFAQLGVRIARGGDVATYEGGDLLATIEDNEALRGAEWHPVNARGERV